MSIKTGWNKPVTIGGVDYKKSNTTNDRYIITTDEELKQTEDYKKIIRIVKALMDSGLCKMGEGYCISTSDIVFNQLSHENIKSHLCEVQLSISDPEKQNMHYVGFDTNKKAEHDQINTHCVVVTDTEIPMIIDLSIAHHLPKGMWAIVERAHRYGDKVLTTFDYQNTKFIYQEKEGFPNLPRYHQASILDRISMDNKVNEQIGQIKKLNYIGIGLSIFAVLNVIGKMFIDGYE
jgi:hypothetical protein